MYQLSLNLNADPNVILLQPIKTKDDINSCRFLNLLVYLIQFGQTTITVTVKLCKGKVFSSLTYIHQCQLNNQ